MIKNLTTFWKMTMKYPSVFLIFVLFFFSIFNLTNLNQGVGKIIGGGLEYGLSFDFFNSIFFSFCLSIGSMVIIFSVYYMPEKDLSVFTFCLMGFIVFMVLLTSSMNLMSMFFGWEGVGVMSFLLIGWFSSREEAVSGAKKAVLFNRVTDFFFFLIILWEMGEGLDFFNSGFSSPSSHIMESVSLMTLITMAFFLSTVGKSAQFMFHPWLTAAMEGPTPVSSLLHSSTMVVAGVFLMFKFSTFLESGGCKGVLNIIMFSSLLTMVGASMWALSQFDLKKIVALSTTSQLSFMFILISLGFPDLAFLHMILHGYFKALIFIGSGVSIHTKGINQDIRISGNVGNSYLMLFFLLGNFGLMGVPFIGAFYSKHVLLSGISSFEGSSLIVGSGAVLMIVFLSLGLTFAYSMKSVHAIWGVGFNKTPLSKSLNSSFIGESFPSFFLCVLSFLSGVMISFSFSPSESLVVYAQSFDFLLVIFIGGVFFIASLPNTSSFYFSHSSHFFLALSALSKIAKKLIFGFLVEVFLLKKGSKNTMLMLPFTKGSEKKGSEWLFRNISTSSHVFQALLFSLGVGGFFMVI